MVENLSMVLWSTHERCPLGIVVFSACLNVQMLSVPLYMMQVYDRVLTTGSVDTLLALTVMVAGALIVFGVLEAIRVGVIAYAGTWLDRELGSPVLAGAVAAALRAGGGVSAQGLRDLLDGESVHALGRGEPGDVRQVLLD